MRVLIIVITSVSEVIMFSPCVFVCVCVYVCQDVCPDDFAMKDWCHTNNILQVSSWGCLVVQVMFHALLTPSMTSPGHIVGQILKLRYLRQYFSYRVDQKLKISEMLMAILLVYSTSSIISGKTVCRDLKMAAILKFRNMKCSLILTSDTKRPFQILPKKYFPWWWRHLLRHRVAPKSVLHIPL